MITREITTTIPITTPATQITPRVRDQNGEMEIAITRVVRRLSGPAEGEGGEVVVIITAPGPGLVVSDMALNGKK